jgi:hypothetical protein
METYPSNSRASEPAKPKEETPKAPKVVQVTTSEIIRRKKPLGKRISETFIGEDAHGVWTFVVMQVFVPAAKDMISDMVSQGIEHLLFGEVRSGGGRRPNMSRAPGRVDYRGVSTGTVRRDDPRPTMSREARQNHNFDEIILETRVEAQSTLEAMFERLQDYDQVTVGDLYQMVGESSDFTDEKWGWTDLRGSSVVRVRQGYLIDLPKPVVLKN